MLAESTVRELNPIIANEHLMLVHGDALEKLALIPDSSVDLIFADPPYHLSNGGFSIHSGRQVPVHKGDWDSSRGVDVDFDFHYQWLAECQRVLAQNGSIWVSGTYHSIYQCGFAMQQLGYRILNDIAWFKPNAAPNLGGRMFTASHESLIWASKSSLSKHVFNYQAMKNYDDANDQIKRPGKQMRSVWSVPGSDDVWSIPSTPAREKIHGRHPTQKPLALLERIILASSAEGATVLDPFVGSGTTGVAALLHGRNFIGIDRELEYLQTIALPRVSEAISKRP